MAQTLVCLRVHVVFSTKDRRPMINPEVDQNQGAGPADVRLAGRVWGLHRRAVTGESLAALPCGSKGEAQEADLRARARRAAEEIPGSI